MRNADAKPKPALGFLTVVDHPDQGLFGGYLVLNLAGRPMEFHCTAPIRPNRAQQILYGPTLESYLFGEQIGQTLVAKSKLEPSVLCTDCEPALAVREFVNVPVALVLSANGAENSEPAEDSLSGSRWVTFRVGRNRLAIPALASGDQEKIADRLTACADWFDLAEPFGRIREAIEEARRGGQAA